MSENKLAVYMQQEAVKARFSELMNARDASAYISSVILAVANNKQLSECTHASIYVAALRAATLRLSVDPGLGQAYLVPFNSKQGKQAALIVGYKGLYDMAIRTGRYRYINVGKVYEGEEVVEDRITGFMHLEGGRKSDKVIGWLGAFELVSGYGKVIYMTCDEIEAHAKKYSKGYGNERGDFWKTEREKMEKKTVLRILLRKWGYIDPSDNAALEEIESDEVLEGEMSDVPEMPEEPETETEEPEHKMTEQEIIEQMGFMQ